MWKDTFGYEPLLNETSGKTYGFQYLATLYLGAGHSK